MSKNLNYVFLTLLAGLFTYVIAQLNAWGLLGSVGIYATVAMVGVTIAAAAGLILSLLPGY
jgi:hypothetical protein